MIYKYFIVLLISDSLLPTISLIRGYFLGKYVIKNNLNRMNVKEEYIENSIFGNNCNLKYINNGYLARILLSVPYIFIVTNYFKNDDANMYYLNNINKYYENDNNSLLNWTKLGFNIGQLIYYNK